LKQQGNKLRTLYLIHTELSTAKSRLYKDVLMLASNIIRNTKSNDPFWKRAETALMEALIFVLCPQSTTA